MKMLSPLTSRLALTLLLAIAGGCSDSTIAPDGGADAAPPDAAAPDLGPDSQTMPPAKVCTNLGLKQRPFNASGPFGAKRHELAADFTVKLQDGSDWNLKKAWTGCESYILIPDTVRIGDVVGAASVWDKDLKTLLAYSPRNVHYLFLGRSSASKDGSVQKAMQARVDTALASLAAADKAHWGARLHVVATHVDSLTSWIKPIAGTGIGALGFAIDRFQRLRGVGSLSDVYRYSNALKAAGSKWPYESNLAYAAHEAMYYNFEAKRQERLDAEKGVTEVKFWKGEVIGDPVAKKGYAELDVTLPSASEMLKFDTLELDVTQRCPKTINIEYSNCGAWDYMSWLAIKDATGAWLELTRLITTYHREGRWVVDMSPMLARLAAGGKQRFKWEWAPPWNTQPTATWLSLRLSNRNKGHRPTKLVPLYQGGKFNETYNPSKKPMTVDIPKTAKKVELWALTSGHGNNEFGCAEFCNHQHRFVVNSKAYLQQFPTAGSPNGCMKQISQGVVPNQWGTWWLGRGGWCPGQEVPAFKMDVTSAVTAGSKATISYSGVFNGAAPPVAKKTANIKLESYLVVYE